MTYRIELNNGRKYEVEADRVDTSPLLMTFRKDGKMVAVFPVSALGGVVKMPEPERQDPPPVFVSQSFPHCSKKCFFQYNRLGFVTFAHHEGHEGKTSGWEYWATCTGENDCPAAVGHGHERTCARYVD